MDIQNRAGRESGEFLKSATVKPSFIKSMRNTDSVFSTSSQLEDIPWDADDPHGTCSAKIGDDKRDMILGDRMFFSDFCDRF